MDARRTIGAARVFMNRSQPRAEFRVRPAARRRRPLAPRVVPAGGDCQHSTHRRNPVAGLIHAHELERRDGTEPVSVANQAAAFDRISRSSRRIRFSRRKRVSSCRSSLVRPSRRRPSSRSRLPHPVSYRLRGWLELLRQLLRTASRSYQLNHSPPVLQCIMCMALGHRGSPSLSPLRHCPRNRVNFTPPCGTLITCRSFGQQISEKTQLLSVLSDRAETVMTTTANRRSFLRSRSFLAKGRAHRRASCYRSECGRRWLRRSLPRADRR